jgi:transposase
MFCVGIDWATKAHTAALSDGPGQILEVFDFPNSYQGYQLLLAAIKKHNTDKDSPVLFAIERKDLRLVDFLLANGLVGYYVDPNRMKSYRRRYKSSGVKSDNQDAFILGDLLYRDRNQLPLLKPDSEPVRELKALLGDRETLVGDTVRIGHRLTECLRDYYPEALDFFSDVNGKVALEFLAAYPTFASAKRVRKQTLQRFLHKRHCYDQRTEKRILLVLKREPVPVPAVLVRVKSRLFLCLTKELQTVREAVAAYDKEIERVSSDNAEVKRYRSLPGAGPIISGGLYTLFGDDRTRFQTASDVRSFVGTAPRTIQSGQSSRVCFRYSCNHSYRSVIQQFARYYNRKRREGKTHHQALRCLAHLWLKIIFAMWRDRTEYTEDRHLASIARHNMSNSKAA